MTFATERARVGRRPVVVVEADLDTCANAYGVAPCAAAGAAGSECYNTRKTCQDATHYSRTTKTYRWIHNVADLPPGLDAIPCVVGTPSLAATRITPGKGLGPRAAATVTLQDFPHHDRGIDPYVATRSYEPSTQGTYFGRLLARSPYYQGRPMRVRTGYITDPWDWANFETRLYLIERIEGPDSAGKVKITGKDFLKLADDDRVQIPAPSEGALSADITAAATSLTLTPAEIATEANYPAAGGKVRIGDEIMNYASRTGAALNTLTRGTDGTTADDHSAGDTVQVCKSYSGVNVVDVLHEILVDYVGIAETYIPYDAGLSVPTGVADEWDTEKSIWLSAFNLNRVISEPTGAKQLIEELMEQCLLDVWWDEFEAKMKLKALAPPLANASVKQINDASHILKGSIKVSEDEKQRVSRVIVHYNKIDQTGDDTPENYRTTYVRGDLVSEGDDEYGSSRTKTVFATWFGASNNANVAQLAGRLMARFVNTPKVVRFVLDAKDRDTAVGGLIEMNTRAIQGVDGANAAHQVQVLQVEEKELGASYEFECLTSSFSGGYWFIAPNTVGDYSAESDENRRRYAFIAPDTNVFDDGREAYKVI